MKIIISLILIAVFAIIAASCGKTPVPTTVPSGEPISTSPDKTTEPTTAPTEPSTEPTEPSTEPTEPKFPSAEEAAKETIISFENLFSSMGADANARRLALELKKYPPYLANYDVCEGEYYCPGLGFSFSKDGIASAYYLVDNFSNKNNIIYIFDIEKDADTSEIIKRIDESAEMDFKYTEDPATVKKISKVSTSQGDKIIFIMFDETVGVYDDNKVAQTPREIVDVFHEYRQENPDASMLDIATYIMNHQRVTQVYTAECEEGRLSGFFGEVTGFESCATFSPIMMPNTFIGYVFELDAGADVSAFIEKIKGQADLGWNVCMVANTIITDNDGNVVLFMMCSEY
ncbi:MAG: hypothetical protein IJQ37_06630 [Clostridia bacterium]|nr:hypothetical protein [Clostridia bacterium]